MAVDKPAQSQNVTKNSARKVEVSTPNRNKASAAPRNEQENEEPITFGKHLQTAKVKGKDPINPLSRSVSAMSLKSIHAPPQVPGHDARHALGQSAVANAAGESCSIDEGYGSISQPSRNFEPGSRSQTPQVQRSGEHFVTKGKRMLYSKGGANGKMLNYSFGKDSSFSSTGECGALPAMLGSGGNVLMSYLESRDGAIISNGNGSFREDGVNLTNRSVSKSRLPTTNAKCDRKKRSPNSCWSMSQDLRGSQQQNPSKTNVSHTPDAFRHRGGGGSQHQRPNIYKLWLGVYRKEREAQTRDKGGASFTRGGGTSKERSCGSMGKTQRELMSNSSVKNLNASTSGLALAGGGTIDKRGAGPAAALPVTTASNQRLNPKGFITLRNDAKASGQSKVLKPITNTNACGGREIHSGTGYFVRGGEKNMKHSTGQQKAGIENSVNGSMLRGSKQMSVNTSTTSIKGKAIQSNTNLSVVSMNTGVRRR
jgi:hypothetical protein